MRQVQLKLADGVYKIKKAETRLKEISAISIGFREGLLKVAEKVQGKLPWIEANAALPEYLIQKTTDRLRIELELLDFCSKFALILTTGVEKTLERCTYFYKKMCIVHNKCQTSSVTKINEFPNKYEHLKYLKDRLCEEELSI